MKKTNALLIKCMLINLIITVVKVAGGIIFNLSALTSDGLHTLSDFITDVIKIISIRITRKKATKSHPFGFGKVEYLSNLLVSLILFLLGIFILYNISTHHFSIPSLYSLGIVIVAIILKEINIVSMKKRIKKTNNLVLINSIEESKIDLLSTISLGIIIILLQFTSVFPILKYTDFLFSLTICFLVFKSAYHIFIDNAISIIGESEEDYKQKEKLNLLIADFKEIKEFKIELTKFGDYYRLYLIINFKSNISLKHAFLVKKSLEKAILSHRSLKINYIIISISE